MSPPGMPLEALIHCSLTASRLMVDERLGSSIRGKVKSKIFSRSWSFRCFQPHANKELRFSPAAPFTGMLNTPAQQFRFSVPAVLIACSRRSQSALKRTSRTVVRWQPWFYSGLMAHSYVGLSEGAYSWTETRCTRHAEPNFRVETHPRTQVSQNRTRHRRKKIPGTERTRLRNTQELFVASDIWRQTRLLSSTLPRRSRQSSAPG